MFNVRIPPQVPSGAPFPVELTESAMQWIAVRLALRSDDGVWLPAVFLDEDGVPVEEVRLVPFGRALVTCTGWEAPPGSVIVVLAHSAAGGYAADAAKVF